ncbi:unnamed protein product [Protopolystoma xenopodis]|uniref:Dynein heavy chain C-terminal domain-containing protein n=1 Tax=Protopolystoma xenopodis TaxID=117903 RepID=A0A3S5A589_9PLAT|nr:unnamed protein product [Protopolystoma xenopodis]
MNYATTGEAQSLLSTILEVQPRTGSTGVGKTNDEIVFEMADNILSRLMESIDLEEAKPDLFDEDEQGRVDSLTTVLTQELDRYNRLLRLIRVS